jgi:type III pantothenate kinase
MQSGIFWGYVSMIEGLIDKIKSIDDFSNFQVVATGGLSHLFKESIQSIDLIEDNLTLIGLVNLFLTNKNINLRA